MNLQQIARKYKLSEHSLDSKEDALEVTAKSLEDIQFKLQYTVPKEELQGMVKTLISFLRDVKNSTF